LNAVIYGAGGAIGGAVARAFAREGAQVFLAGRTLAKLETVAREIRAAGGVAEAAQVDALDEQWVEKHADSVAAKAGGIDIALNAVGLFHVQGTPFAELSFEDYSYPIAAYTRTNFITAKAVARHMARKGSGVILTLSTPVSRMPGPGYMGHRVACAGIEAMTRHLAGELGPTIEEMLAGAAGGTLLKRLPTLADVANTAAFMASDQAGAMTGTVANLTCGFLVD